MVIFNDSNEFNIYDLNRKESSVSTLLIPELLVDEFLRKRKEEHGNNTAVYLRNLLWMYRILTHSGLIPKPGKIKTEYQDEFQNLKRVSFRPGNADWIELGELSIAFGKSRCWIFTFLLKLDIMGLWRILKKFFLGQAVPTTQELELKSFWTLHRFFDTFARSFHVKV